MDTTQGTGFSDIAARTRQELANYQGHPHGQKMRLELVERLKRYL